MWVLAFLVLASAVCLKLWAGGLGEYIVGTQMFPGAAAPLVAFCIPVLEAIAAIALLWPATRQVGWIITGGLSAGFVVFHLLALAVNAKPCPCLGPPLLADARWDHLTMSAIGLLLLSASFRATAQRQRSFVAVELASGQAVAAPSD
jgi:hypothetical protein